MTLRQATLEGPLDLPGAVVTVGTFDGVHLGHCAVLEAVRAEARSRSGTAVAVTFEPHPRTVIDPSDAPGILTSLDEKRWRIGPLGIDLLAVVPFTPAVRNLGPEAFAETYLVRYLGARAVVVGYDHGFGRGRSGGLETMQALGGRYGFDVLSVPPVVVDGEPISSTRIRRLVEGGEMAAARRLLGCGYTVMGRVERGQGRGRTLGFPTANLAASGPAKLMPPDGVYAAWAHLPERRSSVVNLGLRPTFNGRVRALEAHLIDFEGDLYGRVLTLELIHRLRGEQRFDGPEALARQIRRDRDTARRILKETDSVNPLRR